MSRRKWLLGLLGLAMAVHLTMLWHIQSHFQWTSLAPPQWEPIRTNTQRPAHWDRDADPIGPWSDAYNEIFDSKLQADKQKMLRSKPLMAVPARHTDNHGLDFLVRDSTRCDPGGDFFQLYRSGLDLRAGTSIYENYPKDMDPALKKRLDDAAPFHPPNRYPPGFAYTFGLLLSTMTPWNALLFWTILHELALAYCLLLSFRLAGGDMNRFLMAAVMWLAYLPWYLELYMGQTTFIIMTATFIMGAHFLKRKNTLETGAWWALTLITKPLTLLYVPLLFRLKKYKMLTAGLGTAVGSALLYFITRPEDGKLFVQWAGGGEMVTSLGNFCFQNLLYHFHFTEFGTKIVGGSVVVAGLFLTWIWGRRDPARVLCLWVCIYFLGYTHVWQHHLVLLSAAFILPFLVTGKFRFVIPWFLAAVPSWFYLFEGHWNWIREVVYLTDGVLPVVILTGLLLITPLQPENRMDK